MCMILVLGRLEHFTNGVGHCTVSLNLTLELIYQQKMQPGVTLHISACVWDTALGKAHSFLQQFAAVLKAFNQCSTNAGSVQSVKKSTILSENT